MKSSISASEEGTGSWSLASPSVRRRSHNIARARNRVHLFRLRDLGVKIIYRETFPASLDMARHALLTLGFGIAASERAVTLFRQHDEGQIDAQYAVRHDEAQLIQTSREAAAQLQELFEADGLQPLAEFPQAGGRRASAG